MPLRDEAATLAAGAALARAWCRHGGAGWVGLHGPLGAGKTTLVRGFLRELGFRGRVRSPTYTLLEHYEPDARLVWHLDLYRLASADELEFLGVRDLDVRRGIAFVEWPERAPALAAQAALAIELDYAGESGRRLAARAGTASARPLLVAWIELMSV